jgi:hypothetical protein
MCCTGQGLRQDDAGAALARTVARAGQRVWWVPAGDATSLVTILLELVVELKAPPFELELAREGHRSLSALVWQYLEAAPPGWLLVFDNVDLPEELTADGAGGPSLADANGRSAHRRAVLSS